MKKFMRKAWNKGHIEYNVCNKCGKQIRRWLKYCSVTCYRKSRPERKILIKKCLYCKKRFQVYLTDKKQKYCSDKCSRVAMGIKHRGNGHPSWGRKLTEEQKQQLSKSHKGILIKENNPNWRGGISSFDKLERDKFRREIQKLIFKRDNYTCQTCGKRGIDLQVDHIQSWTEYVELRFDMKNCRTLCAKCHYKITFGKPMPENISGWGHNFLKGGH